MMTKNEKLKTYSLKEIPYYHIYGRTDETQEPLPLFWNGSGIEVNVTGSELWIDLDVDCSFHEPWIATELNGAFMSRQMLLPGSYSICLFRNMTFGVPKTMKFFRELQAMSEDDDCHVFVRGFRCDGEFLPVKEFKYKIEFIGDSITSGEGGSGAGEEMTWNSFCFNAVDNYAYMAAKELGAVYNCISQSGWGVFCSWEGNEQQAIPLYYEQVCGLLNGERNKQLGAMEKWDFQKFQPDVIVVNLGTNDGSGTKNMDRVGTAVEDFLRKLRVCNPESYILWCYGMLGDGISTTLEKAVGNYKRKTGDERVEFVKLPDTLEGEFGSRQHPGHRSHEKTAKILVEKILEKMTLLVTP